MKFSFKKTLLITFILLEVSAMFTFAAFVDPGILKHSEATSFGPKVTISFEIARRRDCLGFGICNWGVSMTVGRMNSCSGALYLDEANKNVFIIEIDKAKGISTTAYEKYFKSGIFLMEDESPVPGDVLKALGVSGSRTLQAGKHIVSERNGLLYVSIPAK